MRHFKPNRLTIALQDYHIKSRYPAFTGGIRSSRGIWVGELQPRELCRKYKVKVEYALGETPEVRVLNPKLCRRHPDEPIPHMYEQERLCLYYPHERNWTPASIIADTIVPWTSLWLYFYEHWQVTGEWLGKGMHPN